MPTCQTPCRKREYKLWQHCWTRGWETTHAAIGTCMSQCYNTACFHDYQCDSMSVHPMLIKQPLARNATWKHAGRASRCTAAAACNTLNQNNLSSTTWIPKKEEKTYVVDHHDKNLHQYKVGWGAKSAASLITCMLATGTFVLQLSRQYSIDVYCWVCSPWWWERTGYLCGLSPVHKVVCQSWDDVRLQGGCSCPEEGINHSKEGKC